MPGDSSRANKPLKANMLRSPPVDPCLGFYTRSRTSSIVPTSEPDEDGYIDEPEIPCQIHEESLESVTTPADESMYDEAPQPSLPPIVTIEDFLRKYPPGNTQKYNLRNRRRRIVDDEDDYEPSDSISNPSSLGVRPEAKYKRPRKPLEDRLPTTDNKPVSTQVHTPKRRRNVQLTDPRTTTPFRRASFSGRLPHTDGRTSTKRPLTHWEPLDALKLESPHKKLKPTPLKRNGSPRQPPPLSFVPLKIAETSYASKGIRQPKATTSMSKSPGRTSSTDPHRRSYDHQIMEVVPLEDDEAPLSAEPPCSGEMLSQGHPSGPCDQLSGRAQPKSRVPEPPEEESSQLLQPLSSYFNKFLESMKATATQAHTQEPKLRRRPSTRSGRTQRGISSSPTSALQKSAGPARNGRCLYTQSASSPSSQEENNDFMMPEPFFPSEFAEKAMYATLSKRSVPQARTQDSIPDVSAPMQDDEFHIVTLSSFEHIPSRLQSPASTKAETLPTCTLDLFAGFDDYD